MTKAKTFGAVESAHAILLNKSVVLFNNLKQARNYVEKVTGRNTFYCDIKKTDYFIK